MIDLNALISSALAAAVAEATKPLLERIEKLEMKPADATPENISCDAFVVYLDNQEWFWEKLTRKAGEAAESAVEEAMNDHCTTYDHDDYDNVSSTVNDVDLDNVVTHDNLRDEIQRVLREVTISIDV